MTPGTVGQAQAAFPTAGEPGGRSIYGVCRATGSGGDRDDRDVVAWPVYRQFGACLGVYDQLSEPNGGGNEGAHAGCEVHTETGSNDDSRV